MHIRPHVIQLLQRDRTKSSITAKPARASSTTPIFGGARLAGHFRIRGCLRRRSALRPPVKINRMCKDLSFYGSDLQVQTKLVAVLTGAFQALEISGAEAHKLARLDVGAKAPTHKSEDI